MNKVKNFRENRGHKKKSSYRQYSKPEPDLFRCLNCSEWVAVGGAGSKHRNHCPNCLHSKHLDIEPGDRSADCGGAMEPIAVWIRSGNEWALIHRCKQCGTLSSNRVLADDNPFLLASIASRAIAQPPFPLDKMEKEVL